MLQTEQYKESDVPRKRKLSHLESIFKKGELHVDGSALVMPNGDRREFKSNSGAWEAFKAEKKKLGQWY